MRKLRSKMALPSTKDKIRTGLLITRLQNHALGKLKKPMTSQQIKAAEILLARTLPTLQSVNVDMAGQVSIEVLQVADHKTTK